MAGVLGTALVTAVLGWLLLLGLAPNALRKVADRTTLIGLLPAPPPPSERTRPRPRPRHARRQGAAAPPNLRAVATPVVAPPPVIPPPQPPPVVTAPVAGIGVQASAGAAAIAGPGPGSGGQGNGTGSGDSGDGDGDGGTDLRRLTGDLRTSDVPCFKNGNCPGGIVHLRFIVGTGGRVTSCTVTRSSGSPDLDAQTCAAIVRRLRYKPATNAAGRPIAAEVTGTQRWGLAARDRDAGDDDDE